MNFLPMLKVESLDFTGALGIALLGFVLVLTVLAVLAVFVIILSKIIEAFGKKKPVVKVDKKAEKTVINPANAPVTEVKENTVDTEAVEDSGLPYTPGYVTLDGVSEQDAAVIMAITSKNTEIPLENLCFKSIRRLNQNPVLENISEQDAAVVMAIVANKLDKPIENLCFNSIKLVEA
ncbi:MAG: hypothetical protein J6K49_00045 [Clostridia bacterium]|nr:hypothetical protein [Clostridia bacterium]